MSRWAGDTPNEHINETNDEAAGGGEIQIRPHHVVTLVLLIVGLQQMSTRRMYLPAPPVMAVVREIQRWERVF